MRSTEAWLTFKSAVRGVGRADQIEVVAAGFIVREIGFPFSEETTPFYW